MPKLNVPRGTGPIGLAAHARLQHGVALPADMFTPLPGTDTSPRTAVRYAMRACGWSREAAANATVDQMRRFWMEDAALKAAVARDAWRADGAPAGGDDDDDDAPAPVAPRPVAPAPVAPAPVAPVSAIPADEPV